MDADLKKEESRIVFFGWAWPTNPLPTAAPNRIDPPEAFPMKTLLRLACALIALAASFVQAEPLVDTSSPMETITAEFAMCDGPAWDGSRAAWVPDVKGGKLYRYRPGPKKLVVELADAGRIAPWTITSAGSICPTMATARLPCSKTAARNWSPAATASAKARPNDLVVDTHGGIYYTLTGLGSVIYLAADGKQSVAAAEIDTPNGLALSPDEQTLYVDSYVPKKIWAFPVAHPGALGEHRLLAAMDTGPEKGADGMTIDRAGNIYCTGPAHVWVWNPAGKLLTKIETPTRPINCVFGDGDMQSLYITGIGALYRQRMKITGVPPEPSLQAADQPPSDKKSSDKQSGDKSLSTALPKGVRAELNVVYAQYGDRKLLADIFAPANQGQGPLPALVVVHGGGWVKGDKTKFRASSLALARAAMSRLPSNIGWPATRNFPPRSRIAMRPCDF